METHCYIWLCYNCNIPAFLVTRFLHIPYTQSFLIRQLRYSPVDCIFCKTLFWKYNYNIPYAADEKIEIKNERLKKWLTRLSYNSLGIYVIHYSLFSNSSKHFTHQSNLHEVVTDSVTLVVSFAMVVIINLIIQYLRKNNAIRLLFLGEKSNKNNLL